MRHPPCDRRRQQAWTGDLAQRLAAQSATTTAGQSPAEAQRDYLFDILGQLATIAASCGEIGVEMILKTIVLSRGAPLPPAVFTAQDEAFSTVERD